LTATVQPASAYNVEKTWSSSDESIAEVDQTGKVTAKEEGTAMITVTVTTEDGEKTAQCEVTVIDNTDYGPKAAYFGTWRVALENDFWEQITIGANRIVWLNRNGLNCTLSELTWTETDNPGGNFTADYPKGWRVTGTMTVTNSYNCPKADGSGNGDTGDIVFNTFYISADQQSIRVEIWESAAQEASYGPYAKKLNAEYWQVSWELNGGAWPANDNHAVQAAKDGKLAYPATPSKTGFAFGGWYKESSLGTKISFPYDVSSLTDNFTLYARWDDTTPSATLSVSVSGSGGFYTGITAQRETSSGGFTNAYTIPTSYGTHQVNVMPGSYRIVVTYWACQYVSCMSSGWSGTFSISSGQTRNISIVNGSVGF